MKPISKEAKQIYIRVILYINRVGRNHVLSEEYGMAEVYGANRKDVSLSFDSYDNNFKELIEMFCALYSYKYGVVRVGENREKYIIKYSKTEYVEVFSNRIENQSIENKVDMVKDFRVYSPNEMVNRKVQRFEERANIEDIIDVVRISKRYWDFLDVSTKEHVKKLLRAGGGKVSEFIIMYNGKCSASKQMIAEEIRIIVDRYRI